MSEFYKDWHEARKAAQELATRLRLDVAIKIAKEYGKKGYIVRLADRNSNDYSMAEIVQPIKQSTLGGLSMFRRYGPGKFDTLFDSWVYNVSLDGGPDEELGDVSEIGEWHGLMWLDSPDAKQAIRDEAKGAGNTPLTPEEEEELQKTAAVIISEDDQGSVNVSDYMSRKTAKEDWQRIEKAINEMYKERESENEEDAGMPDWSQPEPEEEDAGLPDFRRK